jgi:hypothetical protein
MHSREPLGSGERPEAIYWRAINEDYEICVYPMGLNTRVCLSERGKWGGILDAWCYRDPARAMEAAAAWSGTGDPLDGWHRNPITGRRREDGDPAREYHRW